MISNDLENINSLPEILFKYNRKFPHKKFLFKKYNNQWLGRSYSVITKNILTIANAFLKKGIKKGDRVVLISNNRIEWIETDLAIMTIGAITVPCFVTNNVDDNIFILKDCKPKLIILENEKILNLNKKILKFYSPKKIILIDKSQEFECLKNIFKSNKILKNIPKVRRLDISTIIYTSGTSGKPKGVVLTHDSIIHNLEAAFEIFSQLKMKNERFISFLPLSHSYERVAGFFFPLLINAEIYFCTSLDKLLGELKEVKPTIFSAVPRLYENIHKKTKFKISQSKGIFFRLLNFLIIRNEYNGDFKNKKKLVLFFMRLFLEKKIKEIFGGKIKVLISGGAALSPSTGFFFNMVGLKLLQGYGQTEAAPLISCNYIHNNNPKTVGFPVKNVAVKISSENEILVKGRNVMLGYWYNKRLTQQTIIDGWLYTGDLGYFDSIGRLIINGRKKELIVTSGGDNISPQKIEDMLKEYLEIEQAVIFGDSKPYLVALVVLSKDFEGVNVNNIIRSINKKLNNVEKIRKFLLVSKPFSYDDGLLTQTLKLKKKEIYKFYKKEIDRMYN